MTTTAQRVVSVAGTSRSGSTVLHLMLGSREGAFACGEVVSLYRPEYRDWNMTCPCGQDPCPIWLELSQSKASRFHQHALTELGVQSVIDSSKDTAWIVDTRRWLRGTGIKHDVVLIWKDPISLAYSFWKRTGSTSSWRKPFVRYHRRALSIEGIVVVQNERLFQDPEGSLRMISDRLALPYEEGMTRFWEAEHHHLFGSLSARLQIDEGESRLTTRNVYPDEFLAAAGDLERLVDADDEVREVFEELRARSIDNADPQPSPSTSVPVWRWYPVSRVRPLVLRTRRREKDVSSSERAAEDTIDWIRGGRGDH